MSKGIFQIRPAGRHILTIGRDLIQDPYAAVVELVKNAYDADATHVKISFKNQGSMLQVQVTDNGHGMTEEIITNKWMVPSTDDKKIRKTSPKGRIMQGRKGIGRYAASILGNELLLETVSEISRQKTTLLVNWHDFEAAKYLSDVDILIETTDTNEPHGTRILITGERDFLEEWTEKQFLNLKRELKKLMTPLQCTETINKPDFVILLDISGFDSMDTVNEQIEPFPLLALFDYKISGTIQEDGTGNLNYEIQKVKNAESELIKFDYKNPTKCGKVSFDIRVFDRESESIEKLIKRGLKDDSGNYIGKLDARRLLNENNGIGVYRNGFRIRPLGDPDFDWLELNKERVQNPSKRIGSDQVIGFVNIENEDRSGLIEKSARDGLKENTAYEALRDLTKAVISQLEERRYIYRSKAGISRKTLKIEKEFEKLFSFDILKKSIQGFLKQGKVNPAISNAIINAIDEKEKEQNSVSQSLRDTIAIYQGQATMGKIVNVVIHEGRKPLSFFKNQIPLFKLYFDKYINGNENVLPELYNKIDKITENADFLQSIFKRIDPLSSVKRGEKKNINILSEIKSCFVVFKSELNNISWSVNSSVKNDIVNFLCWKQDIYSIFTNLIENSIFWINEKKCLQRKISVFIKVLNNEIEYIDYKDTGPGIEKHLIESEVIFDPEFTTKTTGTGTGLGLSIAGEAARRCNFELKAFYSETGAYFRLDKKEKR